MREEQSTALRPSSQRPASGLSPEAAMQRWGNNEAIERLRTLLGADASTPLAMLFLNANRSKEARELRDQADAPLYDRLRSGTLAVSAIPEHGDRREVLELDLWEILWIDLEFEEVVGEGRMYLRPEVFEASAIPTNIREIPDWLVAAFQHDAGYRRVVIHGREFHFGPLQAKVVELLHQAAVTDRPWRSGKGLLAEVGSESAHISDLFKSKPGWQMLIESNDRGDYRLVIRSA
jgi:hypothetical protein